MSTPEKWVAGTLPKRGALPRRKAPAHGAKLVERLTRLHQRNLAGRPLAVALAKRLGEPTATRHAGQVWRTLAITLGIAGGIFGLVLGQFLLLLSGVVLVAAGGLLFWRGRNNARHSGDFFAEVAGEAASLDSYIDEVLPELPEAVVSALSILKELLAEVVARMGNRDQAGVIPIDEQFFIRELMTRYLRDACESYLAVRRANRDYSPLADQRTPEASLVAQIDVLQARVRSVLAVIATSEMEKLARHEAFIATKR